MSQLNTRIVLRNDSKTNWDTAVADASVDTVLLKGEIGIEFDPTAENKDGYKVKMKVGDGVHTWDQLSYFGGEEAKHFEVSSLDEITDTDLAVGDIAVVKTAIYTDTDDATNNKYSYTGYTWNGTDWAAMDGNYSANNVYFDQDLQVTEKIGTIQTLTNGSATLSAEGKNLTQVLSALLATEKNPKGNIPTASISVSGGNAEVGNTFTLPTATLKINSVGSYTYGPATGIVFESGNVTLSEGTDNSVTNESDMVKNSTLTLTATNDTTTYGDTPITFTFKGTATHTEGAQAVTNLGNPYTKASDKCPIPAGAITISDGTATFTGWRNWYTYVGNNTDTIDSKWIRDNCTAKGNAKNAANVELAVNNEKRVVIAMPIGTGYNKRMTSCIDVAGMNLDIFNASPSKFVQSTKGVEGYNGYQAMDYIVYVYENTNGISPTTLQVAIG